MKNDKLKSKIEMKGMLESEIKEEMEKIAEMAKDILIDDYEIFNSSSLKPVIFDHTIKFELHCKVKYATLKRLIDTLNPNNLILEGWGMGNFLTGTSQHGYINLCLDYGQKIVTED